MTPGEAIIATELAKCTFLPASWDKRFAHDMARAAQRRQDTILTPKQRASLLRLAQKYRRQLPTEIVLLAHDMVEIAFMEAKADSG